MWSRKQILVYAFSMVIWALPAAAQVEVEGVTMKAGGDLETGYGGDLSNQLGAGSSHGLGVGGTGNISGSYYNPNFLSFNLQPYYTRAQANADSASVFDTGGYNGNISLFSGSHFPGSVSFSQIWDSTGMYGIPGATGLTTKDSSRAFAIGWSEIVPDLPSLTIGFTRGSASSSLLGSDAQNDVATDSLGIHSSYLVKGFNLGAGFVHQVSDADSSGLLGSDEAEKTNTSTNSFSANVGHRLPLSGGFGLGFTRTDYNSSLSGETTGTNNGTTDNAYGNLSLALWRLPITATATYTDNVYGSLEEQILASGGTLLQTSLTPESRSLLVNVTTGYRILPHVFLNGYVNRQELWLGGVNYGLTQLGANVNADFGKRFRGLTATVGMNDSASKQGNLGAGLVANVNYSRDIGRWELGASFGYDQNVVTLLAIYQTSNIYYNGRVQRRLPGGFSWTAGGGGGRTAFVQVAGNESHSESANSSISWHRCSLGGNFSQSDGTSVLTPNGLVVVTVPLPSNGLVVFNGKSKGVSLGASPTRGLSFSAAWSKANSSTLGQGVGALTSINESQLITGLLTYRYRKLNFNASVVQFRQSISASGTPPSSITTYYFGVSRWFKLF